MVMMASEAVSAMIRKGVSRLGRTCPIGLEGTCRLRELQAVTVEISLNKSFWPADTRNWTTQMVDRNTQIAPEPRPDSGYLLSRLEELNKIGISLSKQTDLTRLLETILIVAKRITNSDGGTLYRVAEDRTLKFEIMRTDSLGLAMGGTTELEIPFSSIRLYDENGDPIVSNVAAYAYHYDTSLKISDAYTEQGFDFAGTRSIDKITGYRSKSFLTVPMKNHENEIIGVLQLLNAKDPKTGALIEFSMEDQQLVESLASQAAIVLTNRMLVNHLENLFESFINLINKVIDDKSPHTGKHCDRVPLLTMMLADA